MCQYVIRPHGPIELVSYCASYYMDRTCYGSSIIGIGDERSSYRRLGQRGWDSDYDVIEKVKRKFRRVYNEIRFTLRDLDEKYQDYNERRKQKKIRQGKLIEFVDRYGWVQVRRA